MPEITGWGRAATGAVSVAALLAGGLATFKTDNEIGTSALLFVGVLGGIVTLLGRIPRIKVGENEIDPGTAYIVGERAGAERVAEAVVEQVKNNPDPDAIVAAAKTEAATQQAQTWPALLALEILSHSDTPERRAMEAHMRSQLQNWKQKQHTEEDRAP